MPYRIRASRSTGSGSRASTTSDRIENVFELLTQPGEFYLDSAGGYVFYVPRADEDLANAVVELPVLETLVQIRGTPGHLQPVNDDAPQATYSSGFGHDVGRNLGDLGNDVHYAYSDTDQATVTFTGTGLDILGETNSDEGDIDVTLSDSQGGVPVHTTVSAKGTTRLAQQVIYSTPELEPDTYQVTLKKHAADSTALVVDGFVVLPEKIAPVHDLSFQGITFAHSTWVGPDVAGYVDNQAGILWDPQTRAPRRVPGAVSVERGQRIEFSGNRFEHLGAAGLVLADGTQDSRVLGNRYRDISAGAILIGDVDDYYLNDAMPTGPSRMTRGITVSNNAITETGVDYHDTVAIWVGNSRTTTVEHNVVAHIPYTGISVGWGWGWLADCAAQAGASGNSICRRGTNYNGGNRVLYNRVYDVMHALHDGGPIYTNGGQATIDGVIPTVAGNIVSNSAMCGYMLYHDEGSTNWHTHSNVVYSTGCRWMGMWAPTVQDVAVGVDQPNYSDDLTLALNNGKRTVVQPPTWLPFDLWPAAAGQIAAQAGLESAYHDVELRSPLVNDNDAAPRYSRANGTTGQWGWSRDRGYGDYEDDVHYTDQNGAGVALTFQGTGVAILGEKNSTRATWRSFWTAYRRAWWTPRCRSGHRARCSKSSIRSAVFRTPSTRSWPSSEAGFGRPSTGSASMRQSRRPTRDREVAASATADRHDGRGPPGDRLVASWQTAHVTMNVHPSRLRPTDEKTHARVAHGDRRRMSPVSRSGRAVLHQGGDGRELDGGAHAVEAGHALEQLLGEEGAGSGFGLPVVDVHGLLLFGPHGEALRAEPRHPFELAPCSLGDLAHSRLVEVVAVAERDEHRDHVTSVLEGAADRAPSRLSDAGTRVTADQGGLRVYGPRMSTSHGLNLFRCLQCGRLGGYSDGT